MKYYYLFAVLLCVAFSSCDGRKSHKESLEESVSKFKLKDSNLDIITYYPKQYTEVATDTILSNTFQIKIKNYSLMDNNVIITTSSQENRNKIEYHRVFESEIVVFNKSEKILETTINAEIFKQQSTINSFWDNATLEHVWVNQESSNDDTVNLEISFINPKDKARKLYQMSIDKLGKYNTFLRDEHI